MDFTEIVKAVIDVGFPVVACCYMARINAKQVDDFRADNRYEAELHRDENAKLHDAIVNNTVTLTHLAAVIEEGVKSVD